MGVSCQGLGLRATGKCKVEGQAGTDCRSAWRTSGSDLLSGSWLMAYREGPKIPPFWNSSGTILEL